MQRQNFAFVMWTLTAISAALLLTALFRVDSPDFWKNTNAIGFHTYVRLDDGSLVLFHFRYRNLPLGPKMVFNPIPGREFKLPGFFVDIRPGRFLIMTPEMSSRDIEGWECGVSLLWFSVPFAGVAMRMFFATRRARRNDIGFVYLLRI